MSEGSGIIKELLAKFTADTSELDAASEKAGNIMKDFGGKAVVAAGIASAAFIALAVHQIEVGEQVARMSDEYGVSATALTQYAHAASLAGVSLEGLGASFKFMQKNIIEAVQGSTQQAEAFKKLGLNARELLNMRPEESFSKIAEALSKVQNPALRTSLALQVMGRAGAQMIPVMKDGAEGLRKAAEEADRFGLTINNVQAGQLEAAAQSIKKVGDYAQGSARQFAAGLAPAISTVIERLLSGANAAGTFQKAGSFLGAAIVEAMELADRAVIKLELAFVELKAGALLAAQAVKAAYGGDQSGFPDQLGKLDDEHAKLQAELNAHMSGATGYIHDYNDALNKAADATAKLSDKTKTLNTNIGLSSEAFKKQYEAAKKAAEAQIKAGNDMADSFIKLKDGLIQSGNLWDNMKKTALNAINEIANNLIKLSFGGSASGGGIFGSIAGSIFSGIGNMFGGSSSFIGGGNGAFSNTLIKWNADGGVTNGQTIFPGSGGTYGAGEMGAEGIFPLTRVNGKLGVAASGGNTTVVLNVQTGVAQTVRAEMTRLLPAIRQAATRAVSEAQIRGTAT